ncbi:hypothetical protein BGZ80_001129 [Entomortierella chlamydospora]|uniref:Uncharacterized protein n=1 Tax=Entomortierella chlamydospora TaxID=101097 RepID=A0A9P6MSF6_9FUNG|nr:hypothetical protein BGZ80_001129 [Entomortierella chlamydospora]
MHSFKSILVRSSSRGMATSLIARQQLQEPIVMASRVHLLRNATTTGSLLLKRQQQQQQERTFAITPSRIAFAENADIEKGVQNITDLFMTARDELEYAEEARGTVYYNEDKETAREAVQECLTTYEELLKDLDDAQKLDVQRKIGLKIMELKSQLDALNAEELE